MGTCVYEASKYLYLMMIVTAGLSTQSGAVYASERVVTSVHEVLTSGVPGAAVSVLSTVDGRVYDVDSANAPLAAAIFQAWNNGERLTLTVEGDEIIAAAPAPAAISEPSLKSLPDETAPAPTPTFSPTISDAHGLGYQATNLASDADAARLFDGMRVLRHRSQCFQRAHVWARDLYFQHSIYSMKVFLFFTSRFIQERHYKWWFHVAPFVYVQGKETVLDPEFVDTILGMHQWTDHFMMDRGSVRPPLMSSPDCTEVAKYQDYDSHQSDQYCYTLKLPMYYYQPLDGEKLGEDGTKVDGFRDWDVANSRSAIP